jgi:hypothetical protein
MSEMNIPRDCQGCFRLHGALRKINGEPADTEGCEAAESVEDTAVTPEQSRRLVASANAGTAALNHLLETCPGMVSAPEGIDFGWLGPNQTLDPECGTDEWGWGYVNDQMTEAYNKTD